MTVNPHCASSSLALALRSLLRRCARAAALLPGKQLHAAATVTGLLSSPKHFLRNALLHLYAVCAFPSHARKLFDEIPHSHKDSVDYTALLRCCAPREGLELFVEMRREGLTVDGVAMVCAFNACARLGDVKVGSQVHVGVVKFGFGEYTKVCNAVMDVYVKCGLLGEAKRVFEQMRDRSVVSWTVVLEGVVKWEGVESGRVVFDGMPERNEVAWTVMIVGYVGNGFTREAFWLLKEMVFGCGFVLSHVTLCSVLTACSQSGDVSVGRWVHGYAVKAMGWDIGVMVGTSLVDMYAKCGRISAAMMVFKHMSRRNVVAWNAMLGGLAMHGLAKVVVDMFPCMVEEVKPDAVTFMALLSACSHSSLVEQGWQYFNDLESVYEIRPEIEHYACMVDLLGRAGHLEEAEILVKKMPIPPNEVVLGSLLGSCYAHGKLQLGEQIMQELVQMDPLNTEYHVLLSNMYALSGKVDKANSLRQVLKKRGIRKVPGMSSIYVDGQLHQFSAGDKSHPRTAEIYIKLDDMICRLRLAGYVPNTTCQVLFGCSSRDDCMEALEEVEQVLFTHSEKLALCFGLMSTASGSPLYIFKNLRICQDCHSAIKIASDIYNREIVVRDRYRFHSFKQGSCSCSDYW
ncbi:pentatricopeptide repeat-containing protein At5g15340, mitochondrial [Gastrolobium bilobum]|uniref:pentatricopeptide repeat-containing protein At5g15340, mitochondrial n=1 Tax=Gastrolobium bilobum TaxID=150636 RepID=UPI002AAF3AF3|nr:pentatricopeptide repeat-containing protein At5g15340, mitochondrial [Gastrolobium bilobum]